MSRQATIALTTLVSRGKTVPEAVKILHADATPAFEGEEFDEEGNLITGADPSQDAPDAPEAPEGDATTGEGDGDAPAPSEPAPEPTPEPDPATVEASQEPEPLEIPANWAELEWAERLALAKAVAERTGITDPTSIKSNEDVTAVMTAAIATLSA